MSVSAKIAETKSQVSGAITSILVLVIVVVVAVVLWKVYKGAKQAGSAVGETLGDAIIAQANNMPVSRVQVCREVANDLDNAISGWGGPGSWFNNVDETAFISGLNRLVNASEARVISRFFKDLRSEGLRAWVNGALSTSEKAQINSTILANIF